MIQTHLLFLARERERAVAFLSLDETGAVVARGALTPDAPPISRALRTIAVVPGADVVTRWLALPDCTLAQAAAAASLLLKDEIAVPAANVHFALGSADEGGERLVCIVERARMQSYIDRLAALGVVPDAIVPDYLMLPAPQDEDVLTVRREGMIAARGPRLAFAAEPELASLILADCPQRCIDAPEEIERLFAPSAALIPIDLMQGEFGRTPKGRLTWRDFRRSAVLAAAVLLSPIALSSAKIAHDEIGARNLEARTEMAARSVAAASRSENPILYLEDRFAELHAGDSFLRTTAVLFGALQAIDGTELETFSYLQDGAIRATLVHNRGTDLSGLAQRLERSGIRLVQDPGADRAGRVFTDITLNLMP